MIRSAERQLLWQQQFASNFAVAKTRHRMGGYFLIKLTGGGGASAGEHPGSVELWVQPLPVRFHMFHRLTRK